MGTTAAACGFVILLLTGTCGCARAPRHTFIPPAGAEVPMPLENGLPIVEARVDGKGPYRFIVDTGSTAAVLVSPRLATELGLPRSPFQQKVRAANGKMIAIPHTRVGSIELGGSEFKDVPGFMIKSFYPGTDGVLGMTLFSGGVLTFHFRDQRLSFRAGTLPADRDTLRVPFDKHVPTLPVSPPARGRRWTANALVDTGSNGGIFLRSTDRDRLPIDPTFSARRGSTSLAGQDMVEFVRLRGSFDMAGFEALFPIVALEPSHWRARLGTAALAWFDLSIDRRSWRVRLVLRGPPASTRPATVPTGSPSSRTSDKPRAG